MIHACLHSCLHIYIYKYISLSFPIPEFEIQVPNRSSNANPRKRMPNPNANSTYGTVCVRWLATPPPPSPFLYPHALKTFLPKGMFQLTKSIHIHTYIHTYI
ncbi:hypothetical protein BDR22DRAFT_859289, partial [Usnea florida]